MLLMHSTYFAADCEYPSDATVFINQKAVFTCVIHGASLYWKVNGTAFTSLERDVRDSIDTTQVTVGENEEFNLIIPGRAEYNGTRVQCVTVYEGGEKESENATLRIQGIKLTSSASMRWKLALTFCTWDIYARD